MSKSLQEWEGQALGHQIDLDNQSYDCVDVPKSWAEYVVDKPWQTSFGWGNAKDLYSNVPTTYWNKIPRGNVPQPGDVFVMNGNTGGGFGHTGVIVSVDGGNMTVYQQNTFTQQAVYTGVYSWNSDLITGFLRPNVPFTNIAQALQGFQRQVKADDSVQYRDAPARTGGVLQTFAPNDVAAFKGFAHGENVDGNDLWFVGRYSGGFSWSGGYTDTGTHDLVDLTVVAAPLQGFQRRVGPDVMNYRKTALVAPDNVIRTFNSGEILDFDAWVHGQAVDGNDIWFRGKLTGGFMWSGGLEDSSTHDLVEVVTVDVPAPDVPPTTGPIDLTDKVIDISSHNPVTDYAAVLLAVRAVIAKAGHTGVSFGGTPMLNGDPTFAMHKTMLGHKLCGAYWYAYPSLDPEVEANAFLTTVGVVPDSFQYWLDLEELDGQTGAQMNVWARKFLAVVEPVIGRKMGLYMNRNWFETVVETTTKGDRPIWLGHFDTPELSNLVTNQVAHQYSNHGTVPGITGLVDLNAVTDQFFPTVPTPPDPDPTTPGTPPVIVDKWKALIVAAIAAIGAIIAAVASWLQH